jgi:hypothetical protein
MKKITTIIDGLSKCTNGQQQKFIQMYCPSVDKNAFELSDIENAIKHKSASSLTTMLTQISNTIRKNESVVIEPIVDVVDICFVSDVEQSLINKDIWGCILYDAIDYNRDVYKKSTHDEVGHECDLDVEHDDVLYTVHIDSWWEHGFYAKYTATINGEYFEKEEYN